MKKTFVLLAGSGACMPAPPHPACAAATGLCRPLSGAHGFSSHECLQAYNYETGKLAIVSQEDAAIWVRGCGRRGLLSSRWQAGSWAGQPRATLPAAPSLCLRSLRDGAPGMHPRAHTMGCSNPSSCPGPPQIGDFIGDELRFASEEGQLFHLPRDNHCEVRCS